MSDRSAKLHSLGIDRESVPRNNSVSVSTLVVAVLVAAALSAAAVFLLRPSDVSTLPAQTTTSVSTPAAVPTASLATTPTAPARTPRASGLVASGYVVARRQATISAEISGRISDVLVEEGMFVQAGDVLARLDDGRARLQLELFQAQHASTRARIAALEAQLDEAVRVHDRTQQLAERNIGSPASVTAAQAAVESLRAQLMASRADATAADVQVRRQQDMIERHIVRAPFAGVVIAKNAQVGEILSPSSAGGGFTRTGVATLVDMTSLEIEVDVNEGQIGRISRGQRIEARLDAYPNWRIPAHVEAIIPTADRSRATIQVRVAFDERDGRILPDMAARVTFIE